MFLINREKYEIDDRQVGGREGGGGGGGAKEISTSSSTIYDSNVYRDTNESVHDFDASQDEQASGTKEETDGGSVEAKRKLMRASGSL